MKMKKLLSIACAVAMLASTFVATTVSASLGGKPTATATFGGYELLELDGESYYIATVNFEIDVTAAETLAAYVKSGNAIKGYTVVGNGVKAVSASLEIPAGFEYFDTADAGILTINATGNKCTYLNTGAVDTYLTDNKYSWSLQYYTADADATGKFNFTKDATSVSGTDSTVTVATKNPTATPWDYDYFNDTMEATGCTIPSYNEWANPTPAGGSVDATQSGSTFTDAANAQAVAYVAELDSSASGQTGRWYATIGGTPMKTVKTFTLPNFSAEKVKLGLVYKGAEKVEDVAFKWE